nr:hypothetical protein [Tanacetum cinerariifolium]
MVKRFEMSMMGEMKFFLGLQVNQFSNGIFINQSKYILDILKRFGMKNCDIFPTPMVEQAKLKLDLVGKPVDHTDYRGMSGSLMYITSNRPDIMFATCDKVVCWSSKKQNYVSISTVESEYVAVFSCCAQVLWMRTQLTDYGFFYDKVPIYCDSKSAIAISCNPVQHTRTKHIDVRCYLLNDYKDVGKLKEKGDIGVFVGYSKESAAFRIYNNQTRKIHESVNVNFDEISEMASKQFSLEPGLSKLNETGKSSNPLISQVDKASKKDLEDLFQDFYDEYFDSSKIMKSSTTNVETPIIEEVFHGVQILSRFLST